MPPHPLGRQGHPTVGVESVRVRRATSIRLPNSRHEPKKSGAIDHFKAILACYVDAARVVDTVGHQILSTPIARIVKEALALPPVRRARPGMCACAARRTPGAAQFSAASTAAIDCNEPPGFDVRLCARAGLFLLM